MTKKPTAAPTTDPLKPSAALLCKLGSIVVHADEYLSPGGHAFDERAIAALLADVEVRRWVNAMGALLPQKRT